MTGACNSGTQHFLNGKKYSDKVSVAFTLRETKGQYGHEKFAEFFNQK
jgi:hypothetical protein